MMGMGLGGEDGLCLFSRWSAVRNSIAAFSRFSLFSRAKSEFCTGGGAGGRSFLTLAGASVVEAAGGCTA